MPQNDEYTLHKRLDYDSEQFRAILQNSNRRIATVCRCPQQKAFMPSNRRMSPHGFDEPLPQQASDPFALLDLVKEKVLDTATGNLGPNMYAYVMAG